MNLLERYKDVEGVRIGKSERYPELYSIKYNHLGVDWSSELVRKARGLVLDKDGTIIARPFEKFFNLDELQAKHHKDLPSDVKALSQPLDEPFEVMDKRDGSLVIMYTYQDEIIPSSSGSVYSAHSELFQKHIDTKLTTAQKEFLRELGRTHTIMWEYTSPKNKIVLSYKEDEMVVIGLIETQTGRDYSHAEIVEIMEPHGIPVVELLDLHTLEEVIDYVDSTADIEGVIIRYESGHRLKLKTEEYFEKSKTSQMLNPNAPHSTKNFEAVIDLLMSGREGDLDDILSRDYYEDSFVEIIEEYRTFVLSTLKGIELIAHHVDEEILKVDYQVARRDELITTIDGFEVRGMLAFDIMKKLTSFRSMQSEYQAVIEHVSSRRKSQVKELLSEVYGSAVNYPTSITLRSFLLREYDALDYLKRIAKSI